MRLEYQFTVPVPVAQAWAVLLDVEQVAPCVPGATLTSFDGDEFAGNVQVKLGPVNLTYQGKGRFVERDEAHRRVVMEANGRDRRGNGTASGTVTSTLQPAAENGSTVVGMVADLAISGRPAQFGRGMIAEVGGKLIGQFADCLAARLAAAPPLPAAPSEVAPSEAAPSEVAPSEVAPSTVESALMGEAEAAAVTEPEAVTEPAPVAEPEASAAEQPEVKPAAVAEPATAPPAAAPPAAAPGPAGTPAPSAPPVDLLAVSAGPLLRRVVPYAIGFVLGALVMWGLLALFG